MNIDWQIGPARTTLGIEVHNFEPGPCSDECGYDRTAGGEG